LKACEKWRADVECCTAMVSRLGEERMHTVQQADEVRLMLELKFCQHNHFVVHPYCIALVNTAFYSVWDNKMSISLQAE